MSLLQTREQLSDLKAIGFALAGFTFWVLTDTSVKIVGQSGLPPYERFERLVVRRKIGGQTGSVSERSPDNRSKKRKER